ncbi:hypothetical protein SAMN05216316_1936 [Nitrosovibrio sp. Nv6]|nr:hypothetical protein SAMN05216316_1936 [Nitrosovibrio sp. Nv6]
MLKAYYYSYGIYKYHFDTMSHQSPSCNWTKVLLSGLRLSLRLLFQVEMLSMLLSMGCAALHPSYGRYSNSIHDESNVVLHELQMIASFGGLR